MGFFSSDTFPHLADAACIHAWEYFHIRIGLNGDLNSLAQVDEILNACKRNPDHSELESLVLCYGVWLGEWIRIQFSGRWIGLNESIAANNGYNLRVPCISGRTANRTQGASAIRENEMTETIHSIDSLIGGLCRCGFVVEDVVEPPHADAWAEEGSPEHRAQFLPPYLKIKARRKK